MILNMHQKGFAALFFVLGISMTLLTWIGLSSSRLFEYIYMKKEFENTQNSLSDLISCADTVIDREIRSHFLHRPENFEIYRNLFLGDKKICEISDRGVVIVDTHNLVLSFVISPGLHVTAQIKNGFVVAVQSSLEM